MFTDEKIEAIYKHIYVMMLIFLVGTTIIYSIGYKGEFIFYDNSTEVLKDDLDAFLKTIPEQFKEGVIFLEITDVCKEESPGVSYYNHYVIPNICISADTEDYPYRWKGSIYHELGHHVWFNDLTDEEREEYRRIWQFNYEKGWLTSEYSEKNVKEGFAEDFLYYHMKIHYMGPQTLQAEYFLDKVIDRILTSE